MIELKDNIDWFDFDHNLKTGDWFLKKEGESIIDWFERVSIPSNWLEISRYRQQNSFWLKDSTDLSLDVLSFLAAKNITKEQMEDDLNLELDLSGHYDFRMSEIRKIKNYIDDNK